MGDWKKVCRCKECGEIYPNGIPLICRKCGTEIGITTPVLLKMFGQGEVILTKKCERVIAKRGIFGWKVKESESEVESKNEDMS